MQAVCAPALGHSTTCSTCSSDVSCRAICAERICEALANALPMDHQPIALALRVRVSGLRMDEWGSRLSAPQKRRSLVGLL